MTDTQPTAEKPKGGFLKKLKKYTLWTIIIALVVFIAFLLFATFGTYSTGYRVGNVIKLSHKGYVFKTWEGQLDQGYLSREDDSGVATRLWYFSVPNGDQQVLDAIDQAITSGKRVKLHYKEKFMNVFFLGDTKYFIFKVEKIE